MATGPKEVSNEARSSAGQEESPFRTPAVQASPGLTGWEKATSTASMTVRMKGVPSSPAPDRSMSESM